MKMSDAIGFQQAAPGSMFIGGNSISNAAAREKAQTIVKNMAARHEAQLLAWTWLNRAMVNMPPSDAEEAALWDLISRIRHERY
jgi:hypothetical protein